MPQYRYKAKSMDGKVCRGRMEALTERDLLKRLEDQGLYCFGWREESKGRARRKIPLGAGLLAPLCRELSVMLSAGVPLAEILAVSGEMAGSSRLKKEILRVREEVYQGHSLSEAMESGEGTFPSLLIYMIRAGETGGELEEILRKMAEYYEKEIGYKLPSRTPFVGKNFNVTRAGIHADGLLKNEEIYNIFDTEKFLNRPVMVAVSNTSGLAGIAHWINTYFRLKGEQCVTKSDPLIGYVKEWVDQEYESGRVTSLTDEELLKIIDEGCKVCNCTIGA